MRAALFAATAVLVLACSAPAGATALGALGAFTPPDDCISQATTIATDSFEGCAITGAHGLFGADAVAVSPDGKNVYMTAGATNTGTQSSDALVRFSRSPTTGAIRELDCVSETGVECESKAAGLGAADALAVSPDGTRVYVAGATAGIVVFNRAPDGSLTNAGCLRDSGYAGDPSCTPINGFIGGGARGVVVSNDGKFVYASTQNGEAIASFHFQTAAPGLAYDGCIANTASANASCSKTAHGLLGVNGLALSPSGDRLYAVSYAGNALSVFTTSTSSSTLSYLGCVSGTSGDSLCTPSNLPGMASTESVAVSSDGTRLYTTSLGGAVAWFGATPAAPGVTALGCLGAGPPATPIAGCARNDGQGLGGAGAIALAPHPVAGGAGAYVAGLFDAAVAALGVDPATGGLVPLGAPDGCVVASKLDPASTTPANETCHGPTAHGLWKASGLTVSPDGSSIYVASWGAVARSGCAGCYDTVSALTPFRAYTPPPPAPPPPPPILAPVLSAVKQAALRWRLGGVPATLATARTGREARRRVPVGTSFRFTLNEPARVRLAFRHTVLGRRTATACVPAGRTRPRRARCYLTASEGALTFAAHAGPNVVRFTGMMSPGRWLELGSHTVVISARVAGAPLATAHTLGFRIVR